MVPWVRGTIAGMPPRTDRALAEGDKLPPTFRAYVCAPRGLSSGTILRRTSYMRNDEEFQLFWHVWDPKVILARLVAEQGRNPGENNTSKRVWEVVLERVRRQVDPRLPSRISCNFAFIEAHRAAHFRRIHWSVETRAIYAVQASGWWAQLEMMLAHCDELRRTDLSLEIVQKSINACEERARKYWSGVRLDEGWPELLVDGRVEIRGELLEPVATYRKTTPIPGSDHYDTAELNVFRSRDVFVATVGVYRRDKLWGVHTTGGSGLSPEEATQQAIDKANVWALGQPEPKEWAATKGLGSSVDR